MTRCAARLPALKAWASCNPLRPSRRGGDVYYLSACSRGSIAIAGVSGHGETLAKRSTSIHRSVGSVAIDPRPERVLFSKRTPHQRSPSLLWAVSRPNRSPALRKRRPHAFPLLSRRDPGVELPAGFHTRAEGAQRSPPGADSRDRVRQGSAGLAPGDLLIRYTDGIQRSRKC